MGASLPSPMGPDDSNGRLGAGVAVWVAFTDFKARLLPLLMEK